MKPKRIYDFGRKPAKRNYTVADLKALKGTGKKLSMSNPANATELRACIDAGIDLLVVWDSQLDECRQIAPIILWESGVRGPNLGRPMRF